MEFIKHIRCPKCDGKIIIPQKFYEEDFGNVHSFTHRRIPTCSKCDTMYNIELKTNDLITITMKEY